MLQPIVYVDISEIREGKLKDLECAIRHLASFVESNVPEIISYGFWLDETQSQMTVVALHPNSSSIEYHMDECGAEFRRFSDLIKLMRIDVYGDVSESVRERLHRKARMLGNGEVIVHDLYAGFTR